MVCIHCYLPLNSHTLTPLVSFTHSLHYTFHLPRSTLHEDIDFVVTDVRNGDFEKDGNYDRIVVFKQA